MWESAEATEARGLPQTWAGRTRAHWAGDWRNTPVCVLTQVPSMAHSEGYKPLGDTCPLNIGVAGPQRGNMNFPAPRWNLTFSFCTVSADCTVWLGPFPFQRAPLGSHLQ